ncbi:MAG: putative toxin-antitoxin system toxin component, PIN family [Candidatus Woesearchaeota archaeon]
MTVVLDTNIYISALLCRGNEFRLVQNSSKFKIKISQEILDEIKLVLSRDFHFLMANKAIETIKEVAETIEVHEKFDVITEDAADNRVLECAAAAKADYVVSGDKHLLKRKEFKGISIVNSAGFLKVIS